MKPFNGGSPEKPKLNQNSSQESIEKPRIFSLEVNGEKIEASETSVQFSEKLLIETGGVEGYTRYRVSWDQVSKLFESFRRTGRSYVDSGMVEKAASKETYQKMMDYQQFRPMDALARALGFSFVTDKKLIHLMLDQEQRDDFAKEGFLEQKLYEIKPGEQKNSSLDIMLLDNRSHRKTDVGDLLGQKNLHEKFAGNIFSAKELSKTFEHLAPDEQKEFIENLYDKNDVFTFGGYNGPSHPPGMSLLNRPHDSTGVTTKNYIYRQNLFAYNLENFGFKEYMTQAKDLFDSYLKDYKEPVAGKKPGSDHFDLYPDFTYYSKIFPEAYMLGADEALKVFLNNKNWENVDVLDKELKNVTDSSDDLSVGFFVHGHPTLPVVQSKNVVPLRWCHAESAFIPTENGVNFIKMKSTEEGWNRYQDSKRKTK